MNPLGMCVCSVSDFRARELKGGGGAGTKLSDWTVGHLRARDGGVM